MKKILPWIIILIILAGLIAGGYFAFKAAQETDSTVATNKVSDEEKKAQEAAEREEKQDLLVEKIKVLIKQKSPGTSFSLAVYDLNNDEYFGFNDTKAQHAASVSKVLTAVYTYSLVEKGTIKLSKPLGAYNVGTQIKYMINVSSADSWDLIDNLVGRESQNKYAKSIGLKSIDVRLNKNVMSPKDATMLLVMLAKGELISEVNRDQLFSYMQNTESEDYFTTGFPQSTIFYHKTGKYLGEGHDNAYVVHDRNPFVLTVFSNNNTAPSLIGRGTIMTSIAQEVYNYFDSN